MKLSGNTHTYTHTVERAKPKAGRRTFELGDTSQTVGKAAWTKFKPRHRSVKAKDEAGGHRTF